MEAEPWFVLLARLRRAAGVPQVEVARKLGVTERNLRYRETGHTALSVTELGVYVGLCGLTDAEIVAVVRGAVPPRYATSPRRAA